jgi:hypothetical protein
MTARDELVEIISKGLIADKFRREIADVIITWALSKVGEDNDETPVGHSYSWNIGYNQRGEEIRGRLKGERK